MTGATPLKRLKSAAELTALPNNKTGECKSRASARGRRGAPSSGVDRVPLGPAGGPTRRRRHMPAQHNSRWGPRSSSLLPH